jgi:hypothetical protein
MPYLPFDPEIESHFLATLVQYPQAWGEVSLAAEKDFSLIHRPIFSVVRQHLDSPGAGPITTILLADKLKSYGVDASKLSGVEPYDYIWALQAKPVRQEDAPNLLKKLRLLTVRRELVDKCKEAEKALRDTGADKFDEMVGIVDKTLSSVNVLSTTPSGASLLTSARRPRRH